MEKLLQAIEQTGEDRAVRLLVTRVDGRRGRMRFHVLASWLEEE